MVDEHPSKTLLAEDAKITFKNFTGREREFNSEGDRNFSLLLEPELALRLRDEGWRVKQMKPRPDEDEGDYHLKVIVNYKKGRPPRCVVISGDQRNEWGSEQIGMLDVADIKKMDMIVNGWWSDRNGGGYSGFLKTIFVWLNVDELEEKYAHLLQPQTDATDDVERGFND